MALSFLVCVLKICNKKPAFALFNLHNFGFNVKVLFFTPFIKISYFKFY